MKIFCCKVNPTGNRTLIVATPVKREWHAAVAAQLMERDKSVEQVGFMENPASECAAARLQMMGGEFCGNASISAAALIAENLGCADNEALPMSLEVSGIDELVSVSVTKTGENSFTGTVDMPVPEAVYDYTFINGFDTRTLPLVRFPGICHVIMNKYFSPELAEKLIADWCRQLNAEALGIMFLNEGAKRLEPLVYVASTDTTVWENSCASGTSAVAAYLASAKKRSVSVSLQQPGGTLSAEAEYKDGAVRRIRLTGAAVIEDKAEIDVNT